MVIIEQLASGSDEPDGAKHSRVLVNTVQAKAEYLAQVKASAASVLFLRVTVAAARALVASASVQAGRARSATPTSPGRSSR